MWPGQYSHSSLFPSNEQMKFPDSLSMRWSIHVYYRTYLSRCIHVRLWYLLPWIRQINQQLPNMYLLWCSCFSRPNHTQPACNLRPPQAHQRNDIRMSFRWWANGCQRFPVHRYSVERFSYSGPSGILGSDGKQNTALAGASGRENCCVFH